MSRLTESATLKSATFLSRDFLSHEILSLPCAIIDTIDSVYSIYGAMSTTLQYFAL